MGIKTTNIISANDSVVIVKNLETLPGGRTLEVAGIAEEVIQAGTPVVFDGTNYKPLSSGKAQAAAANTDTIVKVNKGHYLRIGDKILAGTITAIDTTNAAYDSVTVDVAIGTALALDEVFVNDGNTAVGVVLGSATTEAPFVGIMVRGTVNEAALVNPIDATVKTALPLIRWYSE